MLPGGDKFVMGQMLAVSWGFRRSAGRWGVVAPGERLGGRSSGLGFSRGACGQWDLWEGWELWRVQVSGLAAAGAGRAVPLVAGFPGCCPGLMCGHAVGADIGQAAGSRDAAVGRVGREDGGAG